MRLRKLYSLIIDTFRTGYEEYLFSGVKLEKIMLLVNFVLSILILLLEIAFIAYLFWYLENNAPLLDPFESKGDIIFHSIDCPEWCTGKCFY